MSQETFPQDRRAQVEAFVAALDARDFDALAAMPRHPDLEFRSAFAVAEGGVYRGFEGFREWAANVDAVFEDFRSQLVDFRAADDERAVVIVKNTAKARASGVTLDERSGQVWTWRDGLVWRN